MTEPALAIAVSPRAWPDRLHAYLADHGGARVRTRILRPEDALNESFDVLLIDDSCSFLTRRLISDVRSLGRSVVGVFEPSEAPDGKDRLELMGVDSVISADATPEEVLIALAGLPISGGGVQPREQVSSDADPSHPRIVVGGPTGGAGATEVSIGLAFSMSGWDPILVDLDDQSPSLAARLGLGLFPNLPSAIDAFLHQEGRPEDHVQIVRRAGLRVLAGLPRRSDWSTVQPYAVTRLCSFLADRSPLILNVGSDISEVASGGQQTALARETLSQADVIVGVGGSNPVGVVRLLEWLADLRTIRHSASLHVVVNHAPGSAYKKSQLAGHVAGALQVERVDLLPHDGRVTAAAWEGLPVRRGRFARRVARLSRNITAGQAA